MAEKPDKTEKAEKQEKTDPAQKTISLGVQLTPAMPGDQPIVANYSAINLGQGFAYLDFGFIDPALFGALGRAIKENKPIPKGLRGTRSARIAMPLDALLRLHQQLLQVVVGLRRQAAPRKGEPKGQA